MDPITLAMMGGTALTSLFGASEASRTAQTNADISMLNYYEQKQAREDAARTARGMQADARLGTTDAAGNRTRFVPGLGWVTDLAQDQQQLQNLTEAEQLRQLSDNAARNANNDARSSMRRGREDQFATEADREMSAVRRPDEGALRELLISRAAEARNQSADRSGEMVARQSLRSGGQNAAELMQGARAASDADASRRSGIEATLAARDLSRQEFANERDASRSIMDYFRRMSTSGNAPVTGVTPTGPSTQSSGVADQGLLNILASRPPTLDYQSPNTAATDTMQGLINMFGAYKGLQGTEKEANRARSNMGSWQGIVN